MRSNTNKINTLNNIPSQKQPIQSRSSVTQLQGSMNLNAFHQQQRNSQVNPVQYVKPQGQTNNRRGTMGNQQQQQQQTMLPQLQQQPIQISSNYHNLLVPSNDINGIYVDFSQEDKIKENVKANENKQNKVEYDLEKGLSLEVKTLQKHFQFNSYQDQTLPIMVSVKTLDTTSENKIESYLLEDRPSIDLICVIDNSGSMQGQKINNLKSTLNQLIDMLNENDRLSLITFNSLPAVHSNLTRVSDKNKQKLKQIVGAIGTGGGTSIASGIQTALNILLYRIQQNPVSSIFLLSDGQDKKAEKGIDQLLLNSFYKNIKQCFTIHSFGFGDDHDGPLMQKIAQKKDGSFYYVQRIEQVDEFFIDALGGLFSVVAQDINIEIKINRKDQLFQKFFKDSYVSKTYGHMWKVVQKNEGYSITINQLFSGVSKDFIFEITVPRSNINQLQDFERNVEFINVQMTALPVNNQYTTSVLKDSSLVLTLFSMSESIAQDSEINDNVEFNYLRVKAAEAMQDAMKFADLNQYQNGQVILTEMLKKIDSSHPKNKERLRVIKEDIVQCQQSAQPQVYQKQGRFNMIQNSNNNFNQQSYANRATDIYQNSRQKAMVQQQQVFKSNNLNQLNFI